MTKKEALKTKILELIDHIASNGGTGSLGSVPVFDYYALDYLEFAELNLQSQGSVSNIRARENELISCVSNLKRALDCQIECFLEWWNIRDDFRKRNLGLDTKLAFLAEAGLFTSRTINRFTLMRNKIEHDFRKPQIEDLEALYDLVTAFVAILQTAMTAGFRYSVEMGIYAEDDETEIGWFCLEYDRDTKKFHVEWNYKDDPVKNGTVDSSLSVPEDFAYFFRVMYLLNMFESFSSVDHIRMKLNA